MGGPGSGRARERWAVSDCRCVSVGELLRHVRRATPPGGEVVWRRVGSGELRGSLAFRFTEEIDPQGGTVALLELHYRAVPQGRTTDQEIALERRGREMLALCPDCRGAIRRLYALPRDDHFACRTCQGLVYRRPSQRQQQEQALEELREAMGPLLEAALVVDGLLDGLPAQVRPRRRSPAELLVSVEEERPLFDCELRLWCLRLRAEGLSLRAIARATGVSKSSVARYLAAGPEGIDRVQLHQERFARAADAQLAGLGALSLRAQLRALARANKRLAAYAEASVEEKHFR